jgi:hypothetical protein
MLSGPRLRVTVTVLDEADGFSSVARSLVVRR